MPNVAGKKYPYTKAGMKAASVAKRKKKKGDLVERAYRKKGHD